MASVKPNTSGSRSSSTHSSKGQISMENVSLQSCLERAFDVRDFSLSGPPWLESERFDVVAKIPAEASHTQIGAMLQALLKDRFRLAFHWTPKELSGYAVVVARNGLKIQPVEPTGPTSTSNSRGKIQVRQLSMDGLADILGRELNAPVQNLTSQPGLFDFTLEWTPDDAPPDSAVGPSLFTALQEQLGLRLRAQKITIPTLVVDSIDRVPSGN